MAMRSLLHQSSQLQQCWRWPISPSVSEGTRIGSAPSQRSLPSTLRSAKKASFWRALGPVAVAKSVIGSQPIAEVSMLRSPGFVVLSLVVPSCIFFLFYFLFVVILTLPDD
jgi:hypothetical protein